MDSQATETAVEREVLAVMMTDVHGFTSAVTVREESIEERLQADLRAFGTIIAEHGGQVVADRGDGLKATFRSPVRCFQAALKMQEYVFDQNAQVSAESLRLRHRIGMHIGDTVLKNNHVGGVVVAIAARLEQICPAGKIALSHEFYQMTMAEVKCHRTLLGNEEFKNLNRTVKVWVAQIHSDFDYSMPKPRTNRGIVNEVVTHEYQSQYRRGIIRTLVATGIVLVIVIFGNIIYQEYQKLQRVDLPTSPNQEVQPNP